MTDFTSVHRTNQNRLTFIGLWVIATLAFAGSFVVGYPSIGGLSFLLLGGLAIVVFGRRSTFDERDDHLISQASTNTLAVVGIASGVFFPVLTVLWAIGVLDWPAWLTPIAFFVAGLYGLGLVFFLLARGRS